MQQHSHNRNLRHAILTACHTMMIPIARFLIRNGVGFKEFSEIAKTAFVDVVSDDYGIRGRKTNVSRAAVLAGMTRKEVSRIRKKLDEEHKAVPQSAESVGRPEKVLDAWFHLREYCDAGREPKIIPFEGDGPSFRALAYQVGGDIPPRALLKELLAAGSVIQLPTGELQAISPVFIPDAKDPESVDQAGTAVRDLMNTINHNLFFGEPGDSRIERRVYGDGLDRNVARKFSRLAEAGGEELLGRLNDWLAAQQISEEGEGESEGLYRVGLGVYFFEGKLDRS